MLRKAGNVYVLDLFVRVPSSLAAPIVYTPMQVDAISQVADGREPNFLTAGALSVEDRSKRAETVRPQLDERCEKRRECDGVLNVTNEENGDELTGETDNEDMEDGEMGFDDGSAQVRNIRDPRQPTRAHDHTSTPQIVVQILCDGARCERAAQEIRFRFRFRIRFVNGSKSQHRRAPLTRS